MWLSASGTELVCIWPAQSRGTERKSVGPHPCSHALSVTLMPNVQLVIIFLERIIELDTDIVRIL